MRASRLLIYGALVDCLFIPVPPLKAQGASPVELREKLNAAALLNVLQDDNEDYATWHPNKNPTVSGRVQGSRSGDGLGRLLWVGGVGGGGQRVAAWCTVAGTCSKHTAPTWPPRGQGLAPARSHSCHKPAHFPYLSIHHRLLTSATHRTACCRRISLHRLVHLGEVAVRGAAAHACILAVPCHHNTCAESRTIIVPPPSPHAHTYAYAHTNTHPRA